MWEGSEDVEQVGIDGRHQFSDLIPSCLHYIPHRENTDVEFHYCNPVF